MGNLSSGVSSRMVGLPDRTGESVGAESQKGGMVTQDRKRQDTTKHRLSGGCAATTSVPPTDPQSLDDWVKDRKSAVHLLSSSYLNYDVTPSSPGVVLCCCVHVVGMDLRKAQRYGCCVVLCCVDSHNALRSR